MANTSRSESLFDEAKQFIPGGVNSPVRAFRGVGGKSPRFITRGSGAYLYDADGNKLIDYVGSWGPLILGHSHPDVVKAISEAASNGTSFGAPTEAEIRLARMICEYYPSIDRVRLVNSGTEATMTAIRLARAATRRDRFVKCEGCYHGHSDALLVKAGSGVATLGLPDSPGVPSDLAKLTLTIPYNSLAAAEEAFAKYPDEIACIIIEPIAGNMGCVPPAEGYLQGLLELCHSKGALLIIDEVMTGCRVARGGAQSIHNIKPDITTLGKVIGGGLPLAAVGGRAEIMDLLAPVGPVYQAGTLSGNPLAVAAGIAQLKLLADDKVYERLEASSKHLTDGMTSIAGEFGVDVTTNRVGSMFTMFFNKGPVIDWDSAKRSDTAKFATFFHAMLEQGVYLAPSQFEAAFMSYAHTDEDIEATLKAAHEAFAKL
ncbi:MAG TPA: glutamate-1-semialdehyde 2,1-aminomutase [Blastocatellia bacterium]|nr:glutamate-1-semialdehyde 2,1-aminomutase [Blastocatellia bacterium]